MCITCLSTVHQGGQTLPPLEGDPNKQRPLPSGQRHLPLWTKTLSALDRDPLPMDRDPLPYGQTSPEGTWDQTGSDIIPPLMWTFVKTLPSGVVGNKQTHHPNYIRASKHARSRVDRFRFRVWTHALLTWFIFCGFLWEVAGWDVVATWSVPFVCCTHSCWFR